MTKTITAAPVKKAIQVKAPQAKAFEVFTARFAQWWPKDHHIGKAPMKNVVIEPRQGGRWLEFGDDGSECEWGKVLAWEPPARLVLSWHLNSQFVLDDGVKSEVEVRFIAEGPNATRVELEHRVEAADADGIRAAIDSPRGWSGLLALYAQAASA